MDGAEGPEQEEAAVSIRAVGMDALEVSMKLEQQFGITIGRFDWDRIHYHGAPLDTTAGELHEWVTRLCADQDVDVPPSSWHRVPR